MRVLLKFRSPHDHDRRRHDGWRVLVVRPDGRWGYYSPDLTDFRGDAGGSTGDPLTTAKRDYGRYIEVASACPRRCAQ